MYVPDAFRVDDREALYGVIRENSFGLLMSQVEGQPFATHLPFLLDGDVLVAHMARANPQWQSFFDDDVLVVFWGPHAYVSPRWYERAPAVPTWNYAMVHAYGRPKVLDEREAKHASQRRLVEALDPQWLPAFDTLEQDYVDRMLDGIVNFEVEVTRLETRWKLSQNRGRREQELIAAALEASSGSDERALAALTRKHLV